MTWQYWLCNFIDISFSMARMKQTTRKDQEVQQAGIQAVTMANHQQLQATTGDEGEMTVMGTAGTVPGEEEAIDISLDMECDPKFRQWHDSDEEEDEEEPAMSVDPNIVLHPHHEVHFPLARQLDHSITPPPVLFYINDAKMVSFAMPHVAEQPASTSSTVEIEMGLVLEIEPLNPEVTMAILDPSIACPGGGISVQVSDMVQHYVEGKQAAATPVPIPAPTPGPSTSGVRHAQMIMSPVKPVRWGKSTLHLKVKASKSTAAMPAVLALPVSPVPAPTLSGTQQPPAVSAAAHVAQYFQQSKLWI